MTAGIEKRGVELVVYPAAATPWTIYDRENRLFLWLAGLREGEAPAEPLSRCLYPGAPGLSGRFALAEKSRPAKKHGSGEARLNDQIFG